MLVGVAVQVLVVRSEVVSPSPLCMFFSQTDLVHDDHRSSDPLKVGKPKLWTQIERNLGRLVNQDGDDAWWVIPLLGGTVEI